VAWCTAVLFLTISAQGGPQISLGSPTDFFTNVATRLLKDRLNLDLSQIQIYPNNQYTPAVHRLLQVTANLYDCTTNRIFGAATNYPYCPSVFRPFFRRIDTGSNSIVVIAGYREVSDAGMADSQSAPIMVELDQPNRSLQEIPPYGTPFSLSDKNEPIVSGVPLIIGARKGFPNFNELALQTQVDVSRLLEFRRAPGTTQGPVVQTNQMYVIGISNVFGLEAWNSYLTNYPRDLNLVAALNVTAILTNESGAVVLSNCLASGTILTIPANTWPGWNSVASAPYSMVLPFGTTNGFLFTDSTALDHAPWLEPLTHVFPAATQGAFYVPHWWLNLNIRLVFILVDSTANRIVDYVNLSRWEPTVDINSTLAVGSTSNVTDYRNPANEWITNRLGNSTSTDVATYGIINQLMVGLNGTTDWQSYTQDPYSGLDAESAVDGFRYNLASLSPIYPKDAGKTFYKSNVFYAPFDPYRPIYIHTSWQANDPLVHYTVNDLLNLSLEVSNKVDFFSHVPPLENLGRFNTRYQPWGGNPSDAHTTTDYQVSVKDPMITRSDDWDFPTNQILGVGWVGRVHRGTPWQTLFLKSTNILQTFGLNVGQLTWEFWTGNNIFRPDLAPPDTLVPDAVFTAPTNDWHLVSLLNIFFNPNAPQQLATPNQSSIQSWEALLEGMTVLTNVSQTELDPLTMSSNSPQAAIIAQAILDNRSSQPGQLFQNAGDLLATPELSIASPWLSPSNAASITDEALEMIPSQLLPLLRPDSIGSALLNQAPAQVQFTGMDGYGYCVQVSSNLLDWTSISTNTPDRGVFDFVVPSGGPARFYRSKLIP
jgi:hypothetical protein